MTIPVNFTNINYNPVTGFVIWMWLVAALSLALIPALWQYRSRTGVPALIMVLIAMAIWNIFSGMEYISADVAGKAFWMRFTYIGVCLAPTCSLLVGRMFITEERRLHPALVGLMMLMSGLTVLAAFTNPHFGLMWRHIEPELVDGMPIWEYGIWFYIWAIYSYLAFAGTWVMVIRAVVMQRGVYRAQAIGMLIALTPPWIANALYLFNVNLGPLNYYFLTPFTSGISAVMMVINLTVFRFLQQVPVARTQVLESMNQGVLVLDEHLVILDANPALCELFSVTQRDILGKNLATDFPIMQPYLDEVRAVDAGLYHEFSMETFGYLNIRISPINRQGVQQPGWVVLVEDISEQKQAEQALMAAHQQLQLKVKALEKAQNAIKTLGELVPICAWCGRRIQQEDGAWVDVDKFIEQHSQSAMTHGICPECANKFKRA